APPIQANVVQPDPPIYWGMGYWNCTASDAGTARGSDLSIYGGPRDWLFVVGGSYSGTGFDPIKDHVLYTDTVFHSLFRWISLGVNRKRNYVFNINVSIYDPSD